MKLDYNVTGQERKNLVNAVSTALAFTARYLGAPTFSYEVGGYHIGKTGMLTGADSHDLEDALRQAGFAADSDTRAYDEPEAVGGIEREENSSGDMPEVITIDLSGMNVKPEVLAALLGSKESLIAAALGEDCAWERENGTEGIPILFEGDTVKFPWLRRGTDGDVVKAWMAFLETAVEFSKKIERVVGKDKVFENEKFAFRVFMVRLGMNGNSHAPWRRILLRNLDDNSAFATEASKERWLAKHGSKKGVVNSRPTYTAHCYTFPNGSEEDAMDSESTEFTSSAEAKAFCDEFDADCESLKFAGCHVEDDNGTYFYEILTDGTVNEK
jgi:hypothetical protein